MVNNVLEELTHQEVHFIAEDEEIVVVPNFSLPQLHLLGGTQGKCNVIPPGWLDVTTIKSILEKERGDDVFQGLPFHYIELATDLCKYAREDLQDWNLSYDVMDSIRAVRHRKIQNGLKGLDARALKGVKLNNLTAMEVNIIRPFMSSALDRILDMNGSTV